APIRQGKGKSFELHRHVHRPYSHVRRNRDLYRREIQYRLDPGLHDLLHDRRRALGRRRDNGDVKLLLRRVFLEVGHRTDGQRFPALPDLGVIDVVDCCHDEPTLGESAVAGERRADLTGSDDADPPLFSEAKNLTQLLRQLGNGIAEPSLTEGSEQGKIFANLGGRGSPQSRELVARYGLKSLTLDPFEKAQIQRKAPDSRFSYPLQTMPVK